MTILLSSISEKLMRPVDAWQILLLILANSIFIAASLYSGISRPLFNIDYAICILLFLNKNIFKNLLLYFILLSSLFFEIFCFVGGVFRFSFDEFVDLFSFFWQWPWLVISIYAAIIALSAYFAILIARLAPKLSVPIFAVIGVHAAFVFIDGLNGSNIFGRLINLEWRSRDTKLAFSGVNRLQVLVLAYFREPKLAGSIQHGIISHDLAKDMLGRSDVMIVTAESLGVYLNKSRQNAFQSKIIKILSENGLVGSFDFEPSFGNTIVGESRVLCGTGYGNVLKTAEKFDCLPKQFGNAGYLTFAAHGYYGGFYRRNLIYPKFGFKEINFLDNKDKPFRKCVGAFVSICDKDSLNWLIEQAPGHRRFLYLMSIENHLPMPLCAPIGQSVLENYEQCQLNLISSIIKTSLQSRNPMRVIIVGDHPPPYVDVAFRSYFQPSKVMIVSFDIIKSAP